MSLGQSETESMVIDVGELRQGVKREYPQQKGEPIQEYIERTMPEVIRVHSLLGSTAG